MVRKENKEHPERRDQWDRLVQSEPQDRLVQLDRVVKGGAKDHQDR